MARDVERPRGGTTAVQEHQEGLVGGLVRQCGDTGRPAAEQREVTGKDLHGSLLGGRCGGRCGTGGAGHRPAVWTTVGTCAVQWQYRCQ